MLKNRRFPGARKDREGCVENHPHERRPECGETREQAVSRHGVALNVPVDEEISLDHPSLSDGVWELQKNDDDDGCGNKLRHSVDRAICEVSH
jgi:hypothetical protein